MVRLADVQKRHELPLNLLQLGGIFLIGIFQVLKGTAWVDIVTGIDAHLLAVKGSDISRMSREMHISHKGRLIAIGLQTGRDVLHVLRLTGTLGGEAHQFAARIDDTFGLRHTTFGIVGIHRCHRLDADGVGTANADITDTRLRTNSSYTHILSVLIPRWPFQS